MTIETIIVEDTVEGISALKTLLKEYCPNIKIVGEAYTNEEAYTLIKKVKPKLAFLDINLERGTSFDLLKRLSDEDSLDFLFIFFTAHGDKKENYIQAIRFAALDFFNKPIDKNELINAINKAEDKIMTDLFDTKEHLEVMIELLTNTNSTNKPIGFPLNNGRYLFPKTEEILWLQTAEIGGLKISNVTEVFLKNGGNFKAMKPIGFYKKLLTLGFSFFPINQSVLVNMDFIKTYNPNDKSITLKNGKSLIASRRSNQKLRHFLAQNQTFNHLSQDNSTVKMWFEKLINKLR